MKVLFFFCLISAALLACTKRENCPKYFQIPVQVVPALLEYHVGDTITIVSKFSRKVPADNPDSEPLGTFDMKGIYWKPSFLISRFDSTEESSVIDKYFHFITDSSFNFYLSSSSQSSKLLGEYNFENDSFHLVFRLVAHTPGLYFSSLLSDNFSGQGEQQDFPGKCKLQGFGVRVQANGGSGDNNVNLFRESPNEHFNTWILLDTKERFDKFGGYCFRVVP